jgi:hypothetical protein
VTAPRLALDVLPGRFAVCRLSADAAVPAALLARPLVSVTRTPAELSIVCAEESAPADARSEPGWRCLRVRGPLAFDLVGVVAALVAPLAAAGVSVFVVSTFDTDYLLVKEASLPAARAALSGAGHVVAGA